jgi:hypothetical protein
MNRLTGIASLVIQGNLFARQNDNQNNPGKTVFNPIISCFADSITFREDSK